MSVVFFIYTRPNFPCSHLFFSIPPVLPFFLFASVSLSANCIYAIMRVLYVDKNSRDTTFCPIPRVFVWFAVCMAVAASIFQPRACQRPVPSVVISRSYHVMMALPVYKTTCLSSAWCTWWTNRHCAPAVRRYLAALCIFSSSVWPTPRRTCFLDEFSVLRTEIVSACCWATNMVTVTW